VIQLTAMGQMDIRHIALIQQSFEQTAAFGDRLSELFYTELFAIDPSLRTMFDGDLRRQQMKFMMMLALIVRSLHKPEHILNTVQHLAIKHVDYGVRPEHYSPFGNALLRTLRKMLGPDYTRDVADAWEQGFRMLAGMMKQAELDAAGAEGKLRHSQGAAE
jgi:hemoglobin-like flavoprotein